MFDKIKEKVIAVITNGVAIAAVFGVVVPEAELLTAVNATAVAASSIVVTVVGWQAAIFGDK